MNPSNIGTPVRKIIDTWHFWFHLGQRHVLVWDITMRRERDIERPDPNFCFFASLNTKETPKEAVVALVGTTQHEATDMPAIRQLILAQIKLSETPIWRKVIVIGAGTYSDTEDRRSEEGKKKRVIQSEVRADVDDFRTDLTWGVGEECNGWYRSEPGRADKEPARLLPGYWKDNLVVTVYPYSDELLESLRLLKARMVVIGDALKQITQPEHIEKIRQLPISGLPLLPPVMNAAYTPTSTTDRCCGTVVDDTTRYPRRTCSCGDAVVRQPWMNDDQWETLRTRFEKEHASKPTS